MKLTRRTMLGAMGGVAVGGAIMAMNGKAAAAENPAPASNNGEKIKIIDVRMRPPFGPYIAKNGLFDSSNNGPMAIKNFCKSFNAKMSDSMSEAAMDKLFAEMDRCGDMTGIVSIRRSPKGYENDALVELLKQYPNRFLGACGLPPTGGREATAMIDKYIINGPCISAFLEPGHSGFHINDPKIFPIYDACEKNNIPLLISYGGFHGPTDEYCLPIHAQNVADIFPNLKMALCHACWPWADAAIRLAFKYPNVYLSPDIYGMESPGSESYIHAANHFIPKKILYGSAYPIVDLESSVNQYLAKLNPAVVKDVMHDNAARFFGLSQ